MEPVKKWRQAIAPNLSPATLRQRESYLRVHILPRFGQSSLREMGTHEIQQFATDLRGKLSQKTITNVLSSVFSILAYAERCGMKVVKVDFADLELGSSMLAPILRQLGIPSHHVGLHAFRHGLATELANAGTPLPVLKAQMRHADVKTTLQVYSHVIQPSHREAMERASRFQSVRETGTVRKFGSR